MALAIWLYSEHIHALISGKRSVIFSSLYNSYATTQHAIHLITWGDSIISWWEPTSGNNILIIDIHNIIIRERRVPVFHWWYVKHHWTHDSERTLLWILISPHIQWWSVLNCYSIPTTAKRMALQAIDCCCHYWLDRPPGPQCLATLIYCG